MHYRFRDVIRGNKQLIYEETKWSRRFNQLLRNAFGIQNRLLYSFRDDASSERETKAAGVKTDQPQGSSGRPTDQRPVTSNCNKISSWNLIPLIQEEGSISDFV